MRSLRGCRCRNQSQDFLFNLYAFLHSLRTFYELFIDSLRLPISNLVSRKTLATRFDNVSGYRKGKSMWSIQDVSAEKLAKLFHHYRGALAHDFDCASGNEASSSWDRAPQHERKLLVAAARLALLELATAPTPSSSDRQYFAKPGEADWGC
jgi:hypothetical protein